LKLITGSFLLLLRSCGKVTKWPLACTTRSFPSCRLSHRAHPVPCKTRLQEDGPCSSTVCRPCNTCHSPRACSSRKNVSARHVRKAKGTA